MDRMRWPGAAQQVALPVAGALAALGQAPWGLWPVSVLALGGVFWLVAAASGTRAAFGRAWLAGAASFGVALFWVVDPFLVEPEVHGWMAPFALVLLAGGLALLWGLAAAFAFWALRARVARALGFALAMLGFEALRGVLFTGFPWALSGHIWIGTPVDQLAALGGGLLLSALTLALAAGLAVAALRLHQRRPGRAALVLGAAGLALAGAWGFGLWRLAQPLPAPRDLVVRLVQANVPQHLKWHPGYVESFFDRHLDLSRTPPGEAPDLVIWPETAAPFFLDRPGDGLEMIAAAARVPVLLGLQRRERGPEGVPRYFNSLAVLNADGVPVGVYDKHHLVPFGEYIPLLGALAEGWGGLASRVLTGYTPGPGPVLLDLGGAGRVLPLICYEAVFARNLRSAERADWIVQITNDAWFGSYAGPYQHFAQARLRAIETGLPLVRAANTGISALIDARGRVGAQLGLDQTGVVQGQVPGALPPTPYARWGDTGWWLLLGAVMAGLAWRAPASVPVSAPVSAPVSGPASGRRSGAKAIDARRPKG